MSDAGPASEIVLLCFNYRNYLAVVSLSVSRAGLTCCSGGGQKVTVTLQSFFRLVFFL